MAGSRCPICNAGAENQERSGNGYYCKACGAHYTLAASEIGSSLADKYLGHSANKSAVRPDVKRETPLDLLPLDELLAKAYAYEQGEQVNLVKAFEYFKVAAERGDADAMYKVGYDYETGRGTKQDRASALFWYREGEKSGNQRCARVIAERFSDAAPAAAAPAVAAAAAKDLSRAPSAPAGTSYTGLSLPELCERLLPSVVRITNPAGNSQGTGFIVSQGFIITNAHVVTYTDPLGIKGIAPDAIISFHPEVSGKKYRAKVVAYEVQQDVAILQCEVKNDLASHSLRLADSDLARIGEDVFTIGNGEGLGIAFTKLYISQKAGLNEAHSKFDEVLQLSGGTNHGNSGGPVFNMRGEVVGVVTFGHLEYNGKKLQLEESDGQVRIAQTNDYVVANNMSFAITSNTVRRLAKRIGLIL